MQALDLSSGTAKFPEATNHIFETYATNLHKSNNKFNIIYAFIYPFSRQAPSKRHLAEAQEVQNYTMTTNYLFENYAA